MTAFIDNMKFPLSKHNINNLMLINFHISLITKRFFRSFDSHSNKTVTFSELLPNINKFRNKRLYFFRKFHERWLVNCSSYCDARLQSIIFLKKKPSRELIPVNLQRIAELSSPSYILYTLLCMMYKSRCNPMHSLNGVMPGARHSKLLTDSLSYGDRIHNDGCSKVWHTYVYT